jgi:CRP-like cAMP-binding protein
VRELRRREGRGESSDARARAVLARLRSVPFFQALPEDLIDVLARDAVFVEFGAGERVVQQHEAADACYVVDAGRLAVLVTDGTHEKQVAVLDAGALFGEMGLLTGEPRSATVRAIDDARLVVVGPSALRAALERSPDLASRLAEAVMLRKEGLLEARAGLDALSRARVDAGAKRLREVIKRFFRLPEVPAAGEPPSEGSSEPPGRVAGGDS